MKNLYFESKIWKISKIIDNVNFKKAVQRNKHSQNIPNK